MAVNLYFDSLIPIFRTARKGKCVIWPQELWLPRTFLSALPWLIQHSMQHLTSTVETQHYKLHLSSFLNMCKHAACMHTHVHAKRLFVFTFLFSDQVMTWADWWNKKKYLFKRKYIKTEKLTWSTTNLSVIIICIYTYISPRT